MKISHIICVYLMCIGLFLYAGEKEHYGISVGLVRSNINYNVSKSPNLLINLFEKHQQRYGVNISAFIHLYRFKNLTFVGELNYQQRGDEIKTETKTTQYPEGSGEFIISDNLIEYLSLSSGLKYQFATSIVSPYLKTCISMNRLIRNRSTTFAGSDDLRDWLPSVKFGVGFLYKNKYFIEVEYVVDIENAYNGSLLTSLDPVDVKFKYNLLSFSFGLLFP